MLILRNSFANYYWIPLLLGFILSLAYIWTRKEEKFYQDVIFPRQTVWATFAAVVFSTLWLTTALGIDMKQQSIAVQPLLHHAAQTAAELKSAIAEVDIKSTPLSTRTPVTGTVKFDVAPSSISYPVYPEFESAPDLQTMTVTFAITNTGPLAPDALITPTVTGTVNFDFDTASIADTANTENGTAPNLSPITLTLAIVSPLPVNADESSSSAVTGTVQFDFGTSSSITGTIPTKIITASNRLTIPVTFAITNTAPPADTVVITSTGTVNFDFDTSSISDTASIASNLPAITLTMAITHIAPSIAAPANLASQWITATVYAGYLITDTAELSQAVLAATVTNTGTVTGTASYGDLLRFATVSIASLARQLSGELQGQDVSADGIGSRHRASLIYIITATFDSLTNMNTLPYFTIAVLYSVFLLMPWLIYIVYITGRRGKVTAITRKDMADFDLLAEFLRPEPNDDDDVVAAKQWSKALPQESQVYLTEKELTSQEGCSVMPHIPI